MKQGKLYINSRVNFLFYENIISTDGKFKRCTGIDKEVYDAIFDTIINPSLPQYCHSKLSFKDQFPMTLIKLRPCLHCTGTTSAPEQKALRIDYVYTAPVQKLYQIALPFTLYRLPLLIKSQYCYCAMLKNKIHITCPDD